MLRIEKAQLEILTNTLDTYFGDYPNCNTTIKAMRKATDLNVAYGLYSCYIIRCLTTTCVDVVDRACQYAEFSINQKYIRLDDPEVFEKYFSKTLDK